jgi:hypothetical protein
MNRPAAMPYSTPKPKVFRLPPAAAISLPSPVKFAPEPRVSRAWRWGSGLLTLALMWSVATVFFTRDVSKTAAEPGLEGILPPPVAEAQAALPLEGPSTILLRGRSEAIIGQMAKIPAENEPIIETQAVSAIDNNAARELLSIINKY